MRQGNGTDLLGMNDPRSSTIGVIYVSPNDDRKSVLAAILTQEKLGRKQIAVALPAQNNKAFQRPQDFDDLKTIKRKLTAQLVFIAPNGPGPAEFARQRRFPVYSSLESYADALRDEENPQAQVKRGGFFSARRRTNPVTSTAVAGAAGAVAGAATAKAVPGTAGPVPVEGDEHADAPVTSTGPGSAISPRAGRVQPLASDDDPALDDVPPAGRRGEVGAVGAAGAGILAADLFAHAHPVNDPHTVVPAASSADDDWDALPPAQSGQSALPVTPSSATPPRTPVTAPGPQVVESGAGPNIIELPSPARGRVTAKLPPREAPVIGAAAAGAAVGAAAAQSPSALTGSPTRGSGAPPRRTAGKLAPGGAAVVAGAAGAAAATSRAGAPAAPAAPVARAGGSSRPPLRGGAGGPGGSRRPPARWLVGLLLLLLTLLIISGVVVSMNPGLVSSIGQAVISPGSSPATVTITPDSKRVQDSYLVRAVTGTPDPAQRQVGLHQLAFTTPTQTKTVNATGQTHTQATTARGRLTFLNGSFSAYTVAAGTTILSSSGVSVVTDEAANIPPGTPGGPNGTTSVTAHAAAAGTGGNIVAMAVDRGCCSAGNFIFVENRAAFSGGQDQQNYTFLQQSDVDGAVGALKDGLTGQAQSEVKKQVRANEQMVGDPQCNKPGVRSNQAVGDQGQNVTSATVSVSVTCTGLAYDLKATQTLVTSALQNKANSDPGDGYVLAGNIVTQPAVTTVKPDSVVLQVSAQGIWYYQFTDQLKAQLARIIAGKSRANAQTLLAGQKGIGSAKIDISGGGSTLPTDPKQITINVQPVAGLTAADLTPVPTVSGSNAAPNNPGTAGTPVAIPANGDIKGGDTHGQGGK